jgi:hypothetical protein
MHILDYTMFIIVGTLALIELIKFKFEYFPSKPRYSETIVDRYMDLKLNRRFTNADIRNIPKLKNFDFSEGQRSST